jgi:membrane fusion protein (multidrug efflux system)
MAEIIPPRAPAHARKGLGIGARYALVAGLIIAAVVGVLWFIDYQAYGRFVEGTDDAYIRADAVTVSPKISGYVEQVYVTDNQDIRAGQPLVRIDARDYAAQAAQYRAQIDVAQANADNIRAGIREQAATIDQARAQLRASQASARFSAGEVARYVPLAASGAETGERLASLRNEAAQAADKAAGDAAALASAERRILSLQAQVRQARAQGEAAQAQRSAADVNLGSTTIRASIDGRIGDKSVRVGQFVSQGIRMMSVVPVQAIYIIANFKETQLGLMRRGQPARISVDALPGIELKGHVESVSPGTGAQFSLIPPQNATGNFTKIVQRVPVRIAIDAGAEARRVIVPGMSAAVRVDTKGAKGDLDRIDNEERSRPR